MKRNVLEDQPQELSLNLPKKSKDVQKLQPVPGSNTESSESSDEGRKVAIEVNNYPMNLENFYEKRVYKMNVSFTPDSMPSKILRSALEEFNNKHYPSVIFAYDSRHTMYTTRELKGKSGTVPVLNKRTNKTVDLLIVTNVMNVIEMNHVKQYLRSGSNGVIPNEAVRALNVVLDVCKFVLECHPGNLGTLQYCPPSLSTTIDIEQLRKTFVDWKPFDYDNPGKLFTKDRPLLEIMENDMCINIKKELDPETFEKLEASVKGIHVHFILPSMPQSRRYFKVGGLFVSSDKYFFELAAEYSKFNETQWYSVAEYYKAERDYNILYPHLPCLCVGKKKLAIPIELCSVLTPEMKFKSSPVMMTIMSNATVSNYVEPSPAMREFGIKIEDKLAFVSARVLEEPTLAYAKNMKSKPQFGSWRACPVAQTASLDNWAILNLDPATDDFQLKFFEMAFVSKAAELSMNVKKAMQTFKCPVKKFTSEKKSLIFSILLRFKSLNVDMVVVIIPNWVPGTYAGVKQTAELEVGILTQCIKSSTLKTCQNNLTLRNILLKINSKMEGVNHKLALPKSLSMIEGTIILGGYVTQTPNMASAELVEAAVAATHDRDAARYNMQWRVQPKTALYIVDLEDMVHQQLVKYAEHTGRAAARLLFYRDGLLGNKHSLTADELTAMRRACARLDAAYRPPMTYITVQKKTRVRIRGDVGEGAGERAAQPLPNGTVVDSRAAGTAANGPEHFYLFSKCGKKTVSMPTKYNIIWNENNFTTADLEKVTYDLCFMSIGDTRSRAYPVPVQFARLAALRARIYRQHEGSHINGGSLEDNHVRSMNNTTMTGQSSMFFV